MRLSFFTASLVVLFTVTVVGCKSGEKSSTAVKNNLLVQLTDVAVVSALEADFKQYELYSTKVVSRPVHIFLFEYNATTISEEKLIALLKQSEYVKEAQPNRAIQLRKNE